MSKNRQVNTRRSFDEDQSTTVECSVFGAISFYVLPKAHERVAFEARPLFEGVSAFMPIARNALVFDQREKERGPKDKRYTLGYDI